MTGESRRAGVSAERVAAVLAEHRLTTPVQCRCGWRETDGEPDNDGRDRWATHVAAAVAAALDDGLRERVEALADEFAGSVLGTDFFGNPLSGWVPVGRLRAILAAQPTADRTDQ